MAEYIVEAEMIEDLADGKYAVVKELIRCKDCAKRNKGINDVSHKEYICPLVAYRGKAQGNEFDYQFCVFGKK